MIAAARNAASRPKVNQEDLMENRGNACDAALPFEPQKRMIFPSSCDRKNELIELAALRQRTLKQFLGGCQEKILKNAENK
jgi:hypothetical protein